MSINFEPIIHSPSTRQQKGIELAYQKDKEEYLLENVQKRFSAIETARDLDSFVGTIEVLLEEKYSEKTIRNLYLFLIRAFRKQENYSGLSSSALAAYLALPKNSEAGIKFLSMACKGFQLNHEEKNAVKIAKKVLQYLPQNLLYLNGTYRAETLALIQLQKYEDAMEAAFGMAVTAHDTSILAIAFQQNYLLFQQLINGENDKKILLPFLALHWCARTIEETTTIQTLIDNYFHLLTPKKQQVLIEFLEGYEKEIRDPRLNQQTCTFHSLISLLKNHSDLEELHQILFPLSHLAQTQDEIAALYELNSQIFDNHLQDKSYTRAIRPLKGLLICASKRKEYKETAISHVFTLVDQLLEHNYYKEAKGLISSTLSIRPDPVVQAFLKILLNDIKKNPRVLTPIVRSNDMRPNDTVINAEVSTRANGKKEKESAKSQIFFLRNHPKPEIDDPSDAKRRPPPKAPITGIG